MIYRIFFFLGIVLMVMCLSAIFGQIIYPSEQMNWTVLIITWILGVFIFLIGAFGEHKENK